MKDLFLISGLGADKRVFDFLDLQGYNVHHLTWIDPDGRESIEAYAKRLTRQIHIDRPVLIGVSFGGMIGIEIGKLIETEKIILISSAKTGKDIPSNFLTRNFRLHAFIPSRFIKKPNSFLYWLFGVTREKEKELLQQIMEDTNVKFFRWALDQIVHWKNETTLSNIVQIHGTEDRMLPFVSADYEIEGGGHLMIVNRAADIDPILKKVLA